MARSARLKEKPAESSRFPSQRMSPDEQARWEELRRRYGGEGKGADKRTLLTCMSALESVGDMTNRQLVDELYRRLQR